MKPKKLSVVIPCYNEEATIAQIVGEVKKVDIGGITKEIIIVDDCSQDKTRQIAEGLAKKDPSIKLLFQDHNQGKGAALKAGFMKSTGDLVIVQDADLEYDPNDYKSLIELIAQDKADVVYGSRFRGGTESKSVYLSNRMANSFLTWFSNLFTGLKLTDMETCYKMFRGEIIRDIAPKLHAQRFGFEPEITARLAKAKVRVQEIPINYNGRSKEEGKKIGLSDGIKAVAEIVRYNLFTK
jgi:glycosyltransferase involved in cell wall biosynthesis